jgi:hypothetical protein
VPPQIKYETFLEDVNNILTSGEVPNLFPKDELGGVLDEVRPAAKAAGAGDTLEQVSGRPEAVLLSCRAAQIPFCLLACSSSLFQQLVPAASSSTLL